MIDRAFLRVRGPVLLVLVVSVLCLSDQFLFRSEERSTYIDQSAWIERHSRLGRSRYRTKPPAHRWGAWSAGPSYYTAHLANGRRFQLAVGDNGHLRPGDSVSVTVAMFSGRVLEYEKQTGTGAERRISGDHYEELVPFPILLLALGVWSLLVPAWSNTAYYLKMSMIVIGLSFLIALFAKTLPLFRALGWV